MAPALVTVMELTLLTADAGRVMALLSAAATLVTTPARLQVSAATSTLLLPAAAAGMTTPPVSSPFGRTVGV
jgi:hypothetical protein